MNKQFLSTLTKLEDYEFITLEHHITIARMVRDMMGQNAIDEKTMAARLDIDPKKMKQVLNGSYPFDLRILSKIQSFSQELAAENAKLKIEARSIEFKVYKDSYPMVLRRIEELIQKFEQQKP